MSPCRVLWDLQQQITGFLIFFTWLLLYHFDSLVFFLCFFLHNYIKIKTWWKLIDPCDTAITLEICYRNAVSAERGGGAPFVRYAGCTKNGLILLERCRPCVEHVDCHSRPNAMNRYQTLTVSYPVTQNSTSLPY